MKSVIVVILSLLILSAIAFAEKSLLSTDGKGIRVQGFSPDPAKDVILTGNRQTVDMSNDVAWGLSPASDCKYRNHSTVTVTGNLKTIVGGTDRVRVVNESAAFGTYSGAGCANEILERQ